MTDRRANAAAVSLLLAGAVGCPATRSAPARHDAVRYAPASRAVPSDTVRDSVAILLGAADIAECDYDGDEATAALIDSLIAEAEVPVTVYAAGDLVYERGTTREFNECYGPTWGRFKSITRPVPGNHEYKNGFLWFLFGGHADPYFAYFDSIPGQAGEAGDGWYRYKHGTWDIFALNTGKSRKLSPGSRQWVWLEQQLEASSAECSIVYLHNPRFSTGKHGDNEGLRDAWELLSEHGVDLWIAGHDHSYQRFLPQTSRGDPDPRGIRQFIVGTGGSYLHPRQRASQGRLERRTDEHHGVIKLTLHPDRYEWEFIIRDGSVWDSGSSACQNTRTGTDEGSSPSGTE